MRPYLLFIALLSVCQYVNELIYILQCRNVKNTGIEPITSLLIYYYTKYHQSVLPLDYIPIFIRSPGQI